MARIDSSPSINEDGILYIGSQNGKLYALDTKDKGKLVWEYNIESRIDATAAISADGTIYVGAKNGNLYAINPDGTLKWTFNTGDTISSSATVSADGTILVASWNGNLYSIKPDGSLKEKQNVSRFTLISSPSIDSHGTVYIGSTDWKVYAFGK